MESLTIDIINPKAKKLIYDLVDLDLIILRNPQPSWSQLWNKLDSLLPQSDPAITDEEIMDEIKAYRADKAIKRLDNEGCN